MKAFTLQSLNFHCRNYQTHIHISIRTMEDRSYVEIKKLEVLINCTNRIWLVSYGFLEIFEILLFATEVTLAIGICTKHETSAMHSHSKTSTWYCDIIAQNNRKLKHIYSGTLYKHRFAITNRFKGASPEISTSSSSVY